MADLTESSISVFRRPGGANVLAGKLTDASERSVVAAAEVAVPFLVQVIHHRLAEPAGADGLAQIVAGIDPGDLDDPGFAFRSGRYASSGQHLVDYLLADGVAHRRAADTVAEHAGLEASNGDELLSAAAWVVGAQLNLHAGPSPDGESLEAIVEGRELRTTPATPATALAPVVSAADHSSIQPPVPPDSLVRSGPPLAESAVGERASTSPRLRSSDDVRLSGAVPPSGPRRPETRNQSEDDFAVGSSGLVTGVAILLGLMILGLGLWWWLDRQSDDSSTSAELAEASTDDQASTDADTEAAQDDGADGSAGEDADAGAGSDQEAGEDTGDQAGSDNADGSDAAPAAAMSPVGPDGLASISISMGDPIGRTTATGSAELVFDTTADEICYEIAMDGVGEPADGHIHLGPGGVKGGVIVDFGPMTNGLTGCQAVAGEEIDAILADLGGHYVELHDPVEEWTVRAQLAEGASPDGQPMADIAAAQDAADGGGDDTAAVFDPDAGGAIAIVEPGRIVLRGDVSDRETAERVLVDFAGLSELLVVDELVIVDDAPLPSGRVIIDSPNTALFAPNSDVLDPSVEPLVEQLVALLETRAEWEVTVVGHTDSTGDDVINLELSLRRAEAVRQELIDRGIDPARVRVRGAGSTDPLADNSTNEGRAQNRRIEFEIER